MMGSSNPNQYDKNSQNNTTSVSVPMGQVNFISSSQKVLETTEKPSQGKEIEHQGSLSSWNDPKKAQNYESKDDDLQNSIPSADVALPPAYNFQNEPAVSDILPLDTNGQNSLTDMLAMKNQAFSKYAQNLTLFDRFQPLKKDIGPQTNLLNQVKKMQK